MELIKIKLGFSGRLPTKATSGSAGWDLYAAEEATISAGCNWAVSCGFSLEIPENHAILLLPRSGLAFNKKITLSNSPGLIDSDYRNEIKAIIHNNGDSPFEIKFGDRIAQMILIYTPPFELVETDILSETLRNMGGIGSTGV
jgi:dUTP pyrophosphatase